MKKTESTPAAEVSELLAIKFDNSLLKEHVSITKLQQDCQTRLLEIQKLANDERKTMLLEMREQVKAADTDLYNPQTHKFQAR